MQNNTHNNNENVWLEYKYVFIQTSCWYDSIEKLIDKSCFLVLRMLRICGQWTNKSKRLTRGRQEYSKNLIRQSLALSGIKFLFGEFVFYLVQSSSDSCFFCVLTQLFV